MMVESPTEWTHHRAKVAALSRDRSPDDPQLLAARRDLAAANVERYVARVVAEAPPLTPEQRDRIARLLRNSGAGAAA